MLFSVHDCRLRLPSPLVEEPSPSSERLLVFMAALASGTPPVLSLIRCCRRRLFQSVGHGICLKGAGMKDVTVSFRVAVHVFSSRNLRLFSFLPACAARQGPRPGGTTAAADRAERGLLPTPTSTRRPPARRRRGRSRGQRNGLDHPHGRCSARTRGEKFAAKQLAGLQHQSTPRRRRRRG